MNDEFYDAMRTDSHFQFKSRMAYELSKLSYDELIPVYNTVTEIINMEYKNYDFCKDERQQQLVGKVFLTTSLARYVSAFGEEYVQTHLKNYNDTDACVTLTEDGMITTIKSYKDVNFTSKILDYLMTEDSDVVGRTDSLEIRYACLLMADEFQYTHPVDGYTHDRLMNEFNEESLKDKSLN